MPNVIAETELQELSGYQYHGLLTKFVERVSLNARLKMLKTFMEVANPSESTTILDVGVTSDTRMDSNFFEAYYPLKSAITAVGLEEASFLERLHPGVKFVQADALSLPFPDQSFDIVVSFAVIEHVGSPQRQKRLLQEACRSARAVFVTTPNRGYPIEFHTLLPLLHWLPKSTFRRILKLLGNHFMAQEDNLNLLNEGELAALIPQGVKSTVLAHKLLGWKSNLILYLERNAR